MQAAALFIGGLGLLIVGAELVVRGGGSLAASLGVKPLVLGLTVVAVGTSVPELAVGITASAQESGALAVGNIAGTNMVNILFILGLSALIRPLPLHLQVFKLELPMMVVAATLMTVFALDGSLSRFEGGILLAVSVFYTIALVRISSHEARTAEKEVSDVLGVHPLPTPSRNTRARGKYAVLLCVGLILSVLGADWLVSGAVDLARTMYVSEAVIGLTIVAVGTSAPELVTTIVSTIKDERDIAVGNLLGSSIYNILVILGLTCLLSPAPLPVEKDLLFVDVPLMVGVVLLCVPVFVTGKRIARIEGAFFVGMYLAYMATILAFRT